MGFLDSDAAAKFLGISRSTLARWKARGFGPCFRVVAAPRTGVEKVVYDTEVLETFKSQMHPEDVSRGPKREWREELRLVA